MSATATTAEQTYRYLLRADYEHAQAAVAARAVARHALSEAEAAYEAAYLSLMRQKAAGSEISEQKWRNYDAIVERVDAARKAWEAAEETFQTATAATL